jgi:hypothetical protein
MVVVMWMGCAPPKVPPGVDWLPPSPGWQVRDVDEDEAPLWVLYERDALLADVKEIRLVGLVDSVPEVAMAALRFRLLDDQYVPDGLERTILSSSDDEVVIYGRTSLPFPFRDREATERWRFRMDPDDGVYEVVAETIDPGGEPLRGVVRTPLIRNRWVFEPWGDGHSVFTTDTIHDVGDRVLNTAIYAPIRKGLVEDLFLVRDLARDWGE